MAKELLFSVTAADCDWSYYVGPGNGGQKKQKTKSGVICTHRASGASARAHEDRMQLSNKKNAFMKMIETPKFKNWHKIETNRRMGQVPVKTPEEIVEEQMKSVSVEVKNESGEWVKE